MKEERPGLLGTLRHPRARPRQRLEVIVDGLFYETP